MLNYDLFSRMGDHASFINTGRGAQIVEPDLVRALKENAAERLHSLHPQDCMDCGCCTYICPAHIPLADLVRQAAGQVRELEKGGDLHG